MFSNKVDILRWVVYMLGIILIFLSQLFLILLFFSYLINGYYLIINVSIEQKVLFVVIILVAITLIVINFINIEKSKKCGKLIKKFKLWALIHFFFGGYIFAVPLFFLEDDHFNMYREVILKSSKKNANNLPTNQNQNYKFCVYCGNKINNDDIFCPKCGNRIGD
ncbi:MAG: zinc ribbon domain-containing protein [Bacilli bacterium]|nr:zinc ribbon domain-containing protein [Bacilli bacterium]